MSCDNYKSALLDAAASNQTLDATLDRHLGCCPRCRATLGAERELFSRIENVLRARVNETPPVAFLAQVRVRLSKETSADAGSSPTRPVTGAALALVLIATIYPLVNARQPRMPGNSPPPTSSALRSAGVTQTARAASKESGEKSRQRLSKPSEPRSAIPQGPEVLVPPDEQKAFAQFVSRVAGRDVMAEAVVTPAANKTAARNTDLPQVPSVDIADLQLDRSQYNEGTDDAGASE